MSGVDRHGDLQGKRIPFVESELLVPFTLYRAMEQLGAEVVGPVAFPDDVLFLIGDTPLDGAILDSRMDGGSRDEIHRVLRQLHVPFIEDCRCLNYISAKNGCYRLSDEEDDLLIRGTGLVRRHAVRVAGTPIQFRFGPTQLPSGLPRTDGSTLEPEQHVSDPLVEPALRKKKTMRQHTMAYAVVALGLSAVTSFAADFVKAKVVEVDQAARTVTLEHGDIPNLDMPGMTMTFRVGADIDVTKLASGEAIEFTADSVDDEITVTGVRAGP